MKLKVSNGLELIELDISPKLEAVKKEGIN
jgi:hypothetical protein